ncbi:MAG: hypothetical protein LBU69_06115 [Deltaproteobacteria bacterium]|jgi:type IV secretory pathway VirB10-like protein|nr:hypothetical protein [Deltaproteobacteria bacterium]
MIKILKKRPGPGRIILPRSWLLAVLLAVLGLSFFLGFKLLFARGAQDSELSSVANLTPRNVDAQIGGPGTPEYNNLVEGKNEEAAKAARKTGGSFVATPIANPAGTKNETPTKEVEKPEAIEMPPQEVGKVAEGPKRKAPANPKSAGQGQSQAFQGDLKSVPSVAPGPFVVSQKLEREENLSQAPGSETVTASKPLIAPGTILYAVTELAVNSEVPAPVVAKVVGGQLSGTKFMGAFSQSGESLTLSFSQMIDPRLGSMPVRALAVDPNTDSPAVNGKVDRHLLARWGALIASSFLEGLGGALSGRGTTVSVYGDVISIEKDDVNMAEISLEALGQVGSRAATQLEKNFDRPPTVTLQAGSPIGLLILGFGD